MLRYEQPTAFAHSAEGQEGRRGLQPIGDKPLLSQLHPGPAAHCAPPAATAHGAGSKSHTHATPGEEMSFEERRANAWLARNKMPLAPMLPISPTPAALDLHHSPSDLLQHAELGPQSPTHPANHHQQPAAIGNAALQDACASKTAAEETPGLASLRHQEGPAVKQPSAGTAGPRPPRKGLGHAQVPAGDTQHPPVAAARDGRDAWMTTGQSLAAEEQENLPAQVPTLASPTAAAAAAVDGLQHPAEDQENMPLPRSPSPEPSAAAAAGAAMSGLKSHPPDQENVRAPASTTAATVAAGGLQYAAVDQENVPASSPLLPGPTAAASANGLLVPGEQSPAGHARDENAEPSPAAHPQRLFTSPVCRKTMAARSCVDSPAGSAGRLGHIKPHAEAAPVREPQPSQADGQAGDEGPVEPEQGQLASFQADADSSGESPSRGNSPAWAVSQGRQGLTGLALPGLEPEGPEDVTMATKEAFAAVNSMFGGVMPCYGSGVYRVRSLTTGHAVAP